MLLIDIIVKTEKQLRFFLFINVLLQYYIFTHFVSDVFLCDAGHLALHCGKYLHAEMFRIVIFQMTMCCIKSSKMAWFAFLSPIFLSPI